MGECINIGEINRITLVGDPSRNTRVYFYLELERYMVSTREHISTVVWRVGCLRKDKDLE